MPGHYHLAGCTAKDIAASAERSIADGTLPPGTSLPPIRVLAAHLQVNPNTVSAAYRQLRERGAIETAGRRGTRVRARPATTPRTAASTPVPTGARDLADGGPDPQLLPPMPQPRAPARPVGYEDDHIEPELARLAGAALAADGVETEHLVLTSGALDGVERVLGAHLRPGDRVAVEDPGWANLLDLVAAMGLNPAPVPLDDEGMLPDRLDRALAAGARAVVITSRAQNPAGAALTPRRAGELRQALASHPETLLIEDDHGAGVAGTDAHTVTGTTSRWAYVRSMSKAYGPDLRLALVTGDPTTVTRVAGRLRLGPGWVSHALQRAMIDLWNDEHATGRVAAARQTYARRRAALIEALRVYDVAAHGRSGLNVWVPVADETAVVSRLLTAGWAVTPGAPYRISSAPGVRVSMAGFREDDAASLAAALSAARTASTTITR